MSTNHKISQSYYLERGGMVFYCFDYTLIVYGGPYMDEGIATC